MKKFRIYINDTHVGDYEGIDEANALDQYARDAGFTDYESSKLSQDDTEELVEFAAYLVTENGENKGTYYAPNKGYAMSAYTETKGSSDFFSYVNAHPGTKLNATRL